MGQMHYENNQFEDFAPFGPLLVLDGTNDRVLIYSENIDGDNSNIVSRRAVYLDGQHF